MKKYLSIIKEQLEKHPKQRDCDLTLIYNVYHQLLGNAQELTLGDTLRKIKLKQLPSMDTITRLSRMVKKENPELRGREYLERMNFKQAKARKDLNYE